MHLWYNVYFSGCELEWWAVVKIYTSKYNEAYFREFLVLILWPDEARGWKNDSLQDPDDLLAWYQDITLITVHSSLEGHADYYQN